MVGGIPAYAGMGGAMRRRMRVLRGEPLFLGDATVTLPPP